MPSFDRKTYVLIMKGFQLALGAFVLSLLNNTSAYKVLFYKETMCAGKYLGDYCNTAI